MQVEDEELMLQTRAGSLDSLEELIGRYEKRLFAFVVRFLKNSVEAEEVYQEVWLRVFESRTRYERRAKFSTWLYRIATNLCIDRTRRFRPTVAVKEGDDPEEGGVQLAARRSSAPDAEAERHELSRAIHGAVESLPSGQREVFLLAEGEGLSYAEVSEILGVPLGTVKSRMHHACASLQSRLAGHR